jgi:hypothetical protein
MSQDELSVVRLVIREALLSSPRFDRVFARFQRGHLKTLMTAMAGGIAGGEVRDDLPLPFLLMCTMGMGGVPQLVRHGAADRSPFGAFPPPEVLARMSAELLFRAIGKEQGAPKRAKRIARSRPAKKRSAR